MYTNVTHNRVVEEEKPEEERRKSSSSPTPPPSGRQHDNYVNFDIAQIVVKESRREDRETDPITRTPGMA